MKDIRLYIECRIRPLPPFHKSRDFFLSERLNMGLIRVILELLMSDIIAEDEVNATEVL